MIKISFWLKKADAKKSSLEYIIIGDPKVDKTRKFDWGNRYVCEVYLSVSEKKDHLIYGINPINALCNASDFVKIYLQGLINRGYVISEVKSGEVWKLEKKDPLVNLQEKIEAIKNNKDFSQEDKEKILGVLKESFGKSPSPIKDQINKLI